MSITAEAQSRKEMLPQAEKEQHMSIRAKLIGGTSALALLAGVAAAAGGAQAATVDNMFVRS